MLKLWWTEVASELKGCQFLNGLQLKNGKKNNLRTSKLNKDLSQIEWFQCCLSTENSNSVSFYFETKWFAEWNKSAGENWQITKN